MRILILSTTTGYQIRSFGDAAERLGVELVFGSDRCRNLDDPWRDRAVPVRFHEVDRAVEDLVTAARQRPIDGVLAAGDRPVVLAARIAQALGLRGNSPEAAFASTNKRLARERFSAAGLFAPWFVELALADLAERVPAAVSFPCVIKPIGLSGSRGVIRANNPEELGAALRRVKHLLGRRDIRAIRSGLEDRVLLEGYIDGPEFAIEGVLTSGRLQAFAIFDKPDPLSGPFFEETIYLTPSALPRDMQARILDAIQLAAAALGLTHGPVHGECRLASADVFVLELAARPIGGLCSRVLRFLRNGGGTPASLEEVLLRHACGEDVSAFAREPVPAGVMMIPIPKKGFLKRVEGEQAARAVPLVEDLRISAKRDQLLEPLPEAGSYLGFIFARGGTTAAVDAALRAAHRELTFVIDAPIVVTAS